MGRVDGKVAIITGGASGLGAEDARMLAREGARVVITDVQDELGRSVASEIPDAVYLHHDVRDEQGWSNVMRETMKSFGSLDVLVNNAGIVRFGTIEDMSYADYKLQVEVMLDGTFLGCKAAIPYMSKDGRGSIINMASTSGFRGLAMTPAYAGAKGGIIAMTRSIAAHSFEQGYHIRCNAVAPGAIETPMTAQAVADLPEETLLRRSARASAMGHPQDIANVVLFLASDESRHISGTTILVDNGETSR